jgi:hypothetical protein
MRDNMTLQAITRKLREDAGNCFLYGCVTLVVLGILAGLASFLVVRNFAREMREKYTEAAPAELPTADLPAAATEALIARVDEYFKKLRAGEPLGTLTLTENEVNALLQNHPDLKEDFGNLVYLTLGTGTATGQMSVPLDWLPMFSGRYFNGTATFDFEVSGGRVELYLTGATVKGEPVPEQFIVAFRSENMAADWMRNDADARTLMEKIDTVKIDSGTVVITPVNVFDQTLVPIPDNAPGAETAPAEEPAATEEESIPPTETQEEAAPPAN